MNATAREPILGAFRKRDIATGPLSVIIVTLNVLEIAWLLRGRRAWRNYEVILFTLAVVDAAAGLFGIAQFTVSLSGVWNRKNALTSPMEYGMVVNACASNSIVITLTLDRTMAVVSPLVHRVKATRTRVVISMVLAVLAGCGVAIAIYYYNLETRTSDGYRYIFAPFIAWHLALIVIMYGVIIGVYRVRSRRMRKASHASQSGRHSSAVSDVALLRSCLLIIVSFLICFSPVLVLFWIRERAFDGKRIQVISLIHSFVMLASIVNPCLYFLPKLPFAARLTQAMDKSIASKLSLSVGVKKKVERTDTERTDVSSEMQTA